MKTTTMTENGHISWIAIRLLAAMTIAAGVVACTKEDGFRRGLWPEDGNGAHPISFSAYAGGMATKAASADGDVILGHWVDSTSTFVPGSGIGVFAFYQKAKSNGYPTDFNKNIGEPTFMYNQKVERTTTDGTTYTFEYSPKKYWPNNTNDQISFFAYAPYDETTAWEDLQLVTNLKGTKITRDYVIEDDVEDQTDFLWADPVLNHKNDGLSQTVHFDFKHLCCKLGFRVGVNGGDSSSLVPTAWTDPNTVLTINKVTIHGVSSRFTYTINWDSVNSVWISSYSEIEGSQNIVLKNSSGHMQNAEISSLTFKDASFKQLNSSDAWLFLAHQDGFDLTLSYSVKTTEGEHESVVSNVYSEHVDVTLETGKAYMVNFLISPERVTVASADVVKWDYDENVTDITIL